MLTFPRSRLGFLALFFAGCFMLPPTLRAQTTVTLTPSSFARIFSNFPDNTNVDVLTAYINGSATQHSFVAFDLSSLIGSGVTVQSATLTLTLDSSGQITTASQATNIFRVATNYVVGAETWNSPGSGSWTNLGGDFVGTTDVYLTNPFASGYTSVNLNGSGYGGQTMTFDVSALVLGWVNGSYPNYGFGIAREAGQNGQLEFYGAGSGIGPSLSITYVSAIPEPATVATGLALFALGAVGVREFRKRRLAA